MTSSRVLSGLLSVALLVFGLVALLPDRASACSCLDFGGSPQQRAERMLDESNAVFAGRVVEIKRSSRVDKVSFRVSEVWKGPERETVTLDTSSQESACEYPFHEGREYLVDATGKTSVGLCSETQPLSEAGELVEALGNGKKPGQVGDALADTSGVGGMRGVVGMAGLAMMASFLLVGWLVRSG